MSVDFTTASLLYYIIATFVSLIGYLIYIRLSSRIEMRTLIIKGRIIQISISIIGFFIILMPELNVLVWVFLTANSICGGYTLFDYPLMMTVTDEDEVDYGKCRERLFLGTDAFFNKIAESLGPIIRTPVLLLFGFVRDAPTQSPVALIGIKFLLLMVTAIINVAGLISIYYFPLHGKKLEELNKKVLLLHKEKTDSFESQKLRSSVNSNMR